jgi:hypothetical protein
LTSRCLSESKRINFPAIDTHSIWELARFEIHNLFFTVLTISIVNSCVHRLKLFFVKFTRSSYYRWIKPVVCWVGFINWVITYDIRIICKGLRNFIPETYKLILYSLFVHIQVVEGRHKFWGLEVPDKRIFITVLDEWKTILIVSKPKVFHRLASSK